PTSLFAATDPWVNPSNLLPNVYANIKSSDGSEIINTLPSKPDNPYNLHDGDPQVSALADKTSPANDLAAIFKWWYTGSQVLGSYTAATPFAAGNPFDAANYHYHPEFFTQSLDQGLIQRGIDVLEGNESAALATRAYKGMPVLHIAGGDQVKTVMPVFAADGVTPIGGNVNVTQVWFGPHIEEDTSYIDTSVMALPENKNLPWTITYTVHVLDRGNDDFSPLELFNSDPELGPALPQVMMDGTFFPMVDGTTTVFKIKMPPARFFQLIYTWGWRNHPGRIAVMENAGKVAKFSDDNVQAFPDVERNVFRQVNCGPLNPGHPANTVVFGEADVHGNPLPGAQCTFGPKIMSSAASKAYAISFIGDLSPAKRMWTALKTLQSSGYNATVMAEYERAYNQWQNRLQLPDGITPDPTADLTLAYLNNSIYGQQKGFSRLANKPILEQWHMRGTKLKVKLFNGDYFAHGYGAVNFGGLRGWENLYQSAHKIGGDGDTFTFGRAYWTLDTQPSIVVVPAAEKSATATIAATPQAQLVMNEQKSKAHTPMGPLMRNSGNSLAHSSAVKKAESATWNFPMDTQSLAQQPSLATVQASNGDVLGEWTVNFEMNYEPSLRLRTYQFDPVHHIQAIWAIH
ncbi:MAG: hypothetical protein ABI114_05500, partial [Rhodanobacter sp.]